MNSEEMPYKLDDDLKAITLDEAIKDIESCKMLRDLDNNDDYWMHCALMTAKAARAYSELLKHAPQIEVLVEAGENATQGKFTLERYKQEDGYEDCLITYGKDLKSGIFAYSVWQTGELKDMDFLTVAANARPTLKEIHDNLTAFGKDIPDE